MTARPTLTLKKAVQQPTTQPTLERFWFVWERSALRPSKRHASVDTARAEAERLRQTYGKEFAVYEAKRVAA